MPGFPFIRVCAILIAALFLLAQGVAQAHVADHCIDHDPECATCAVSIIGEDQNVVPLPKETETVETADTPLLDFEPAKAVEFDSAHPSRAPPPRAPPR